MRRNGSPVLLSLGSNQGDRLKNLLSGLRAIDRLPGTRVVRVSRVYETAPVGGPRQRDYLNLCAAIRTRLSPMGLLAHLKRVEASLGRKPGRRRAPRPFDADILFHGRRRLRTPFLTVPHPEISRRRFVVIPLAELGRSARLNGSGQNVTVFASAPSEKWKK